MPRRGHIALELSFSAMAMMGCADAPAIAREEAIAHGLRLAPW